MEQTEDTLRRQYDGPTILTALRQTEAAYEEMSELFDPAVVEQRNRGLEQTRRRFNPDALEQNRQLNQRTHVNLRTAVQHAARTNEALERCIRSIDDGAGFDNIQREFEGAYNELTETLHYSYLITLPDNGQVAQHV